MKKLPNLKDSLPVYEITLPVSNEIVKYSPYTNKDVKSILIASQEKDYKTLVATLENIMENCSNSVPQTITDFSYLITHINAKSNGESLNYVLKECECGHKKIEIHIENILDTIKIKNKDKIKSLYKLTDNISLRLIPTKIDYLKQMSMEDSIDNMMDQMNLMLYYSIDCVLRGQDVYKMSDYTFEEFNENIASHILPKQKEELNKEIGNLVRFCLEVKYKCPECEKEYTKEINDFLFLN